MLRLLFMFMFLTIYACGDQKPVAETTAVTNGEHVLGIVPLQGEASEQDQRYRLLVCKALPRYSAAMFADASICRSALLTEHGQEVDFVGNKLRDTQTNVIHLEAMSASAARELGQSPIAEKHRGAAKFYGLGGLVIAFGAAQMKYFPIDFMPNSPKYTLGNVLAHSLRIVTIGMIGFGALAILGGVSSSINNAKSKDRRERIGDDAGRVYPQSSGIQRASKSKINPADLLTHQQWRNITSGDFHKATTLAYEDNLRIILANMAKFFKLEVNERALQL